MTGSRITARRPAAGRTPSLRRERALQREGHQLVAGMDEVGRGALAGPVSVGVVIVDGNSRSAPVGLRDSKLLTPTRREQLVAPVRRWAVAWGVGHATAAEIDAVGIMAALRRAGRRALAQAGVRPDVILLDGNHDWLTDPAREGLLGFLEEDPMPLAGADGGPRSGSGVGTGIGALSGVAELGVGPTGSAEPDVGPPWSPDSGPLRIPTVHTIVKGDMRCSSVAAASVLAKVERDALLVAAAADHPAYRWEINKGYAAPDHRAALLEHGPCPLHRQSWNLLAAPPPHTDPRGSRPMGDDGQRHDGPPAEWGTSLLEVNGP